MNVNVGEAFVLLTNGPQPTGSQLATRLISTSGTEIRVGLDKNRFRHLLIALEGEIATDMSSAALILRPFELEVEGSVRTYADLRCSDARLALVFERLALDVIARVEGGIEPSSALPLALREWRDLFKSGAQGITVEQVVGLIGELQVLGRLARTLGHAAALDAWWGPDGHTHDFYAPSGAAIEVKATRSLEGSRVHISNIGQLDPADVESLHLAVFRLKADQKAPTLDERIAGLLQEGFPAAELLNKVRGAGHIYESDVALNTQFKVLAESWWAVNDDFPGLRESRLSPEAQKGVTDIKYQLSLDAAGAPLSPETVDTLMTRWGQ